MKYRLLFVLMLLVSIMLSVVHRWRATAASGKRPARGRRRQRHDRDSCRTAADRHDWQHDSAVHRPRRGTGRRYSGIRLGRRAVARGSAGDLCGSHDSRGQRRRSRHGGTRQPAARPDPGADPRWRVQADREATGSDRPDGLLGLDTEWKALADGIAEAGNLTDALGEQKTELEERIARSRRPTATSSRTSRSSDVNRWSSSDPERSPSPTSVAPKSPATTRWHELPEAAEGDDPLAWTSCRSSSLAN